MYYRNSASILCSVPVGHSTGIHRRTTWIKNAYISQQKEMGWGREWEKADKNQAKSRKWERLGSEWGELEMCDIEWQEFRAVKLCNIKLHEHTHTHTVTTTRGHWTPVERDECHRPPRWFGIVKVYNEQNKLFDMDDGRAGILHADKVEPSVGVVPSAWNSFFRFPLLKLTNATKRWIEIQL